MTIAASSRRRGSTTRSSSRTWGTVSAGDFFPQLEPQPDQEVGGQAGHRQVMMPAVPAPHFVMIHAQFALALQNRRLDRPAHTTDPHQSRRFKSARANWAWIITKCG